ncbi:MAG: DUF6273 domain-containing protein [Lachnospiraceae bacterium]|nr:DUF6273 domain-containing protein [Lachnospiraceae bacterium]
MSDITCKNCGTIININRAQKGIVVCLNCNVENDCSEQIYEYASGLMASAGNEASYRAAAESFASIEGYKDADMYRDNCLEQADICFKDATFLRAKTEMMKGDRAGLSFACHLLESISGWKDADEQLGICKMRLESITSKERDNSVDNIYNNSNRAFVKRDRRINSDTRTKSPLDNQTPYIDFPSLRKQREIEFNSSPENNPKKISKKSAPRKKKLTSIIIMSCIGLALIGALIAVYYTVITPMLRYDDAMDMINEGNYSEGYAMLTELGRESEIIDNKKDRADAHIEKEEFDKAYLLWEETGDEDKISESILSRITPIVEEKKYKEAVDLLAKYKYDSLAEKRFNKAEELISNASYDEAYILLSGNTFIGSEAKKDSIKNVSPEIKFLGKKVGDTVDFGSFELDGNTENGKEHLEWKILEIKDDSCLVICDSFIDFLQFNTVNVEINWEQSYCRKILNLSHYQDMFSNKEKELVLEKNVEATKNPSYDTDPGKDCTNYLFLLSCDEFSRLLKDEADRKVSSITYKAQPNGMNWWLRTPGAATGSIVYVNADGEMVLEGAPANLQFCIRPAMWVKTVG